MSDKTVSPEVSEYMRQLGKKSWLKRKHKQGTEYFRDIAVKRHKTKREKKS